VLALAALNHGLGSIDHGGPMRFADYSSGTQALGFDDHEPCKRLVVDREDAIPIESRSILPKRRKASLVPISRANSGQFGVLLIDDPRQGNPPPGAGHSRLRCPLWVCLRLAAHPAEPYMIVDVWTRGLSVIRARQGSRTSEVSSS